MVWRNGPLALYHGTVGAHASDIEANGENLATARPGRDFGRGFYLTRREAQAIRFANEKFTRLASLYRHNKSVPDPVCAAVIHYTIDRTELGQLDTLVFVSPDAEWQEFVNHCRYSMNGHKGSPGFYYEAVHGPVSTVTNESALRLEQLSLHSMRAINKLVRIGVRRGKPTL
jgi:hypothetical protein